MARAQPLTGSPQHVCLQEILSVNPYLHPVPQVATPLRIREPTDEPDGSPIYLWKRLRTGHSSAYLPMIMQIFVEAKILVTSVTATGGPGFGS